MKFLVDAQLPRRIALWLCEQGHDALHTLDLSDESGSLAFRPAGIQDDIQAVESQCPRALEPWI